MEITTNGNDSGRVVLLVSELTLSRLAGGLGEWVGPRRDYDWVEVGRPVAEVVEQLLAEQPAGVIMEFREELTEAVGSLGFPVVVVLADMVMDGLGGVNVDDEEVGRLAARYLADKRLGSLGYYGWESLHAPERRNGFVQAALENGGVEWLVCEVGEAIEEGERRAILDDFLDRLGKPAGLFAAHEPLSREVMASCRRLGLAVPEDVAVLSASSDPFTCELIYPGISSVEIPWQRLAWEAARMLERMMGGGGIPEPVLLGPEGIRTRGSTDFVRVSDERLRRAVRIMMDRLGEEALGVAEVARAVGMDRRMLERGFRGQLGSSPKAWLTRRRLDRARELLEQTDLRNGEVAERCGFGSAEKLGHAFRRWRGCSPREWRRGNRPGQRMGSGE